MARNEDVGETNVFLSPILGIWAKQGSLSIPEEKYYLVASCAVTLV